VAGQNVAASMGVGTFSVGLSNGALGLLLRGDGTIALEASGTLTLSGGGLPMPAPLGPGPIQQHRVDFSSSRETSRSATSTRHVGHGAGTTTAPLLRLQVTGLQVTIAGGLNLSATFEFEKTTTQSGRA